MTTLRIDPGAQLPPYEQLCGQLIEQIHAGKLSPDTKLPAVRRLAADLGIAPGTVARAYKELESQGYLIARGRHGTIVAPGASANPRDQAGRLTTEYVSAMQGLGCSAEEIVANVRTALAQS